jgi:cytidylate kinase
MIIAIDGPAGSGKSTVAKLAAARLGFLYLDTGAMYRAVACRAIELGLDLSDETAVADVARAEEISFVHRANESQPSRVLIGGHDVTTDIRTPSSDEAVSVVASMPLVREAMVAQQRHLGDQGDIVVEGRDIGTVVFPHADVKVFLTASAEERAKRRAIQHSASGHDVDTTVVLEAMSRRDCADSTRAVSPLALAPDSILLDSTGLTIDEVINRIADLAQAARR